MAAGRAEDPRPGSWADPRGPGRCARCANWLKHDIFVWQVIHRGGDDGAGPFATVLLCHDCTFEVLAAWHAQPGLAGR